MNIRKIEKYSLKTYPVHLPLGMEVVKMRFPNRERVEQIRKAYPKGVRVELIRRYIKQIKVFDDKFQIIFKSGIEVNIER